MSRNGVGRGERFINSCFAGQGGALSSLEDIFIDLRERNVDEREKHHSFPLVGAGWGVEPTSQVCALTGDQTCNLLVCRTTFQPTEPPSQSHI